MASKVMPFASIRQEPRMKTLESVLVCPTASCLALNSPWDDQSLLIKSKELQDNPNQRRKVLPSDNLASHMVPFLSPRMAVLSASWIYFKKKIDWYGSRCFLLFQKPFPLPSVGTLSCAILSWPKRWGIGNCTPWFPKTSRGRNSLS